MGRWTAAEVHVLDWAASYVGLSFSGSSAARRNAADGLIRSGHLYGRDYRYVSGLTPKGRALWNRLNQRRNAAGRDAFAKDKRNFDR